MGRAAEDLADRLGAVERRFGKAAVLFCRTPVAVDVLAESGKVAEIVRVETDAAFLDGAAGLIAPLESVPFEAENLDLAVSLLSLQAKSDIAAMPIQIRRALRPDGLFLGAFAGVGTLGELRESLLADETELYDGASLRVIPFTDVRDAGALLQRAGLALPVADVETVTVRYANLFALLADLRAMGETSALTDRSRRPGARKLFARAAEIYAERFSDPDAQVRASFSIVLMSGWTPDASQQKTAETGFGRGLVENYAGMSWGTLSRGRPKRSTASCYT
ncbi:methyltransferase domain-containing protein [Mesorhizobium sp. M0909]|uniref:methyltransferase domain-containing protein n=1 Tax=Mesorhizobium sp. M0909 TaxID=2957024 RepID=UPI003335614E